MTYDIRPMGDRALLVAAKNPAGLANAIGALRLAGVLEAVPAAETVLIRFDATCNRADLCRSINDIDDTAMTIGASTHVVIPVTYDGEDLDDVANACGIDVADVIAIHCAATYTVAFCGFAPGFAYLSGLDPRLTVSRMSTPRPRVPAGAVAIADRWSAVYPRESPGGWRLLGTTTMSLFDLSRTQPAALKPGDTVQFTRVESIAASRP
jgi:KipI family sensor histidine kinase inhibitor